MLLLLSIFIKKFFKRKKEDQFWFLLMPVDVYASLLIALDFEAVFSEADLMLFSCLREETSLGLSKSFVNVFLIFLPILVYHTVVLETFNQM